MSNRAVAIIAGATLLVGVLIGRASVSDSGGTSPKEGPPGSTSSLDPPSYPRTKEGAATAAFAYHEVGRRMLFVTATERRRLVDVITSDAMRNTIAKESDEAAAGITEVFNVPDSQSQIVDIVAPLGYRIRSFTKDSARVELWTVAVFGAPGVGNGIAPIFKTVTLDLSFERGAWRLAGLPLTNDGPTPIADDPDASSAVARAVRDLEEFDHAAR